MNRALTKAKWIITSPNPFTAICGGEEKCPACGGSGKNNLMTKTISVLLILAMVIQIIKPLGLPGLRRRGDFWKLAVVAFAIWSFALILREFTTL